MQKRWAIGMWILLACGAPAAPQVPVDAAHEGVKLFREKVRPVLEASCFKCHGGEKTRGGLDLSTREKLLAGGDEGAGIVAGDPAASSLIKRIRHLEEPFMPPKSDKLPEASIREIEKWIAMGAPYDAPLGGVVARPKGAGEMVVTASDRQFWSFQPLKKAEPPAVKDAGKWARTPIDRFILAKLEEKGIAANPIADKRKLIRRAYFDLIGLPPTPDDVERFVSDASPDAWEKAVERLLASPQYGERWARHWLDVARYADSTGYEKDEDRPNAYHYRDFVIRALNQDMPYDRFVKLQLAGDLIEPQNPQAWTATGFITAGPTETEKETDKSRYDEWDDMVSTVGSSMLGMTIACARCHDHKYDPIPTKDYYRLLAAFTTSKRMDRPLEGSAVVEQGSGERRDRRRSKEGTALAFGQVKEGPSKTPLLNRGDPDSKGALLDQGFLSVVTVEGTPETHWPISQPRLALAEWITDVDRGAGRLTARVIVNRLWKHHFGRGIVGTPNDFGMQGDRPTHPELLDYLAGEMINRGWSLKAMHRLMMTSTAYMQDTTFDPARAKLDPDNKLLWRRTPARLEAEVIRDSLLAVSGNLNDTMFGPGVKPPLPLEVISTGSTKKWPTDIKDGPAVWRRSVYLFQKRSVRIPMMEAFDAPDMMASHGNRMATTVAPQALAMLNSDLARDQAERFAQRVIKEASGSARDRVVRAYWLALGRPPTEGETAKAHAFIDQQARIYRDAGRKGTLEEGRDGNPAFVDFCQVLLNLNEFVYVE